MKFWILLVCLLVTACQTKRDPLPSVEPVNHIQIKQLVEQNKGKVLLINIWATWCAPCREEMPALLKLRREYHDRDFEIIFVSADDTEFLRTKVQPMLKDFGVDFTTYIIAETNNEAFITGMSPDWNGALPTSFLYDKNGTLVELMIGGKTFEQFEHAVKQLLAL